MHPSLLAKKLIPAFVQRHWQIWLCSLCFVVPFLVAGAGGWLIVQINNDHPGQALTQEDYERNERQVQEESISMFVRDGLKAGAIGLGTGISVVLLVGLLRRSKFKDKSC